MLMLVTCTSDTPLRNQNLNTLEVNSAGLLQADLDDSKEDLHLLEVEDIERTNNPVLSQRNPNTIVTGHYSTNGGHTVTFSLIENPGGIHGKGRITGPNYIDVKFDAACIRRVGNRATIGGRITSLVLSDALSHLQIDTDWIIYLALEDNGEGANADPDRYHAQIYFSMPGFGLHCDLLEPSHPYLWQEHRWFDVVNQGDQIQIQ